MQLNFFQIAQHVKQGSLRSLYIMFGEDSGLLLESLRIIRDANCGRERLRHTITADHDWLDCKQILYNGSLFNQQHLIELYLTKPLTVAGQKFILEYAQRPNPHNIVIFIINKLVSNSSSYKSWLQSMHNLSHVINLWPLSPHEFTQWLVQRATEYSMTLNYAAANYLADNFAGNMGGAAQELRKLSLAGCKVLDHELVTAMVYDQAHFNAFDLVQECWLGNNAKVMRILNYLERTDVPFIMILGAILYEIRIMANLFRDLSQGRQLSALYLQYRISRSRQASVAAFLQRHTLQECYKFISQALVLDRSAKGGGKMYDSQEIWQGLTDLCLAIAAAATA